MYYTSTENKTYVHFVRAFKYQEVIALRFFEQKQMKEISEILGKSEGTVKSLLHRGLEKLRASMDEEIRTQPFTKPRIINSASAHCR